MEYLQSLINYKLLSVAGFDISLAHLLAVPTLLIVGIFLVRWTVRIAAASLERRGVSPDVIQIVSRAIMVVGLIVLAITTLDFINVPLTAFAFVSGAVAIGVGFGAQNIINNFISGWILMWERPIRINDYIEVGDTSGTVEEINTRSTQIRRVDGVHMLVPNSHLLEQTVVNWTLVDELTRCIVRVGVAYGSDVRLVESLIADVVRLHQNVLDDPPPTVVFEDFGDSALIFDVYFWVHSVGEKSGRIIRSDIRFEIDAVFRDNDVVIAFPQQDVHLNGTLDIRSS